MWRGIPPFCIDGIFARFEPGLCNASDWDSAKNMLAICS